MAQQSPSHDFVLPVPRTIKVEGQQLQVYDAQGLRSTLTQVKAALDSLAGRGSGKAQITGPLHMNSNVISGVVNTSAPTSDEAVSYGLAQQQYSVFRPAVSNQTSSSTVQASTGTVLAQATKAPTNQALAPASTVLGRCFTIKKTDPSANPVYVTPSRDPDTGKLDTIDGKANYKLGATNQYVTVQATAIGSYSVVAEGTGDPFEIMHGPLVDMPLLAPSQLYLATDMNTIYVGTFTGNLQVSRTFLSGVTGSIGGSPLTLGQQATGTVSIPGASAAVAAGGVVSVTPVTYPGVGFFWMAWISATDVVTVAVICLVAGTPTASAFNVKVIN